GLPATTTVCPRSRNALTNSRKWVSPPPKPGAELTWRMRICAIRGPHFIEIEQEFGPAYRCRSHFADDDSRSMIREYRGFFHRSAGCSRQSKCCDHRIA